jgi:1-acyl-sn-glycerol-3-phosphate acyltransferase
LHLIATLRGTLTLGLMVVNVIVMCIPLFLVALLKFAIPLRGWRRVSSRWMTALAEAWISNNNGIFALTRALRLDARGVEGLNPRQWYLMLSNHRSWVDILALQAAFNRRIPFLKFFIKERLRWVPFLGLAWWALDMPFMRRHSRAYLQQHPEARGEDLEATRRSCEKFREIPTTVINFVEGTRFTPAKRDARGSPFRHLLLPRAGGTAFALSAMGDVMHAMLDVTIVYAGRTPSLWDLCCGRLRKVVVDVRQRVIEPWMTGGDYLSDPAYRDRFQAALTALWQDKDRLLDSLLLELDGPEAARTGGRPASAPYRLTATGC